MGEAFIRNRARSRLPSFTYTGSYQAIDDGGGNWRIKFLSSGTLTFKNLKSGKDGIDVFLVGGGGATASDRYVQWYGIGYGAGGYTKTQKNISATKGTAYQITVGAAQQDSSAFGYTAAKGGNGSASYSTFYDGMIVHGGSGGTGGVAALAASGGHYTNGASAGSSSGYGYNCSGGAGQGTTTREFGEADGDLYADGGGHDTLATPNSGNGGNDVDGGGCSGIVIIRNHRE